MSDRFRIYIGLVLLLILLSVQGFMFDWLWTVWGELWLFAFLNLLAIDGVIIVLGAFILGIED